MRAVWSWFVVTLVGVIIVVLVLGLGMFGRLDAGQKVLNGAAPIFDRTRVDGAAAGIGIVSNATDLLDPVVLSARNTAPEVGKLVGFVSAKTGFTNSQVTTLLAQDYPHVLALLQTVPFEDVARELPRLAPFLAQTLGLSQDAVNTALPQLYPGITQATTALPGVVSGWDNVPGTAGFTRFDGTPIRTVPQVRDYFAQDVIPVLDRQSENFTALTRSGGVGFLPLLLLVAGLVVIVFGVLMMVLASKGLPRVLATAAWSTVIAVGALVVVLVFALGLFPRLNGGAKTINDVAPILTAERVAGAKAGVAMISTIVDLADPVALQTSTGTQEVPNVVSFVSRQADIPPEAVIPALAANGMPHIATLLQAVSLQQVATELDALTKFLAQQLNLSQQQVIAAVGQQVPRLGQVITALPKVTGVWDNVGIQGFTRLDGTPITTVPQVRDYFRDDVIPVLEAQQANFQRLNNAFPTVNIFPPLLLVIGIIVIIYGIIMLLLVRRGGGEGPDRPARTGVDQELTKV